MSIWGSLAIIIVGSLYGVVLFRVLIPFLKRFKYGQAIRLEGPKSHFSKKGTPTMGGIVIIIVTIFLFLTLILFNFHTAIIDIRDILILIVPFLAFGLIGFIDDYLIIIKKSNEGLKPHVKFMAQLVVSALCYFLVLDKRGTNEINFFGSTLDLKYFYGIFIIIAFTGFTNATNLTDGIDGLLGGSSIIVFVGILMLSIIKKNTTVTYFAIGLLAGLITFLCFNLPKAMIFMGDVGSLAIGSALFSMLLCLNLDVLIFIFGFIYLLETLSVMLQVWFYKKTKGKRLFKMSPLHHHLELSGLKDMQIDVIFWLLTGLVTIIACILGVKVF